MARSYRRRKPKGGYTTVRATTRNARRAKGKATRVKRQRTMKAKGRALRAGLKLNAAGQVVRDRNRRRVNTRARKNRQRRKARRR